MFTKRYINDIKPKINNLNERKLRLATLYFQYKDYETAQRHINEYIQCDNNSAKGHRLNGSILEALGKTDDALEAYQKALQIEPEMKDELLLKICRLIVVQSNIDIDTLKFWLDMSEKHFPSHDLVEKLRDHIENLEFEKLNKENNHGYMNNNVNNSVYYTPSPVSSQRSQYLPKNQQQLVSLTELKSLSESLDEKLETFFKKQEESILILNKRHDNLSKSNEMAISAIKKCDENISDIAKKVDRIKKCDENIVDIQVKVDEIKKSIQNIYQLIELNLLQNDNYSQEYSNTPNIVESYNATIPSVINNPPTVNQDNILFNKTYNSNNINNQPFNWSAALAPNQTINSATSETKTVVFNQSQATDSFPFSMKFNKNVNDDAVQSAINTANTFYNNQVDYSSKNECTCTYWVSNSSEICDYCISQNYQEEPHEPSLPIAAAVSPTSNAISYPTTITNTNLIEHGTIRFDFGSNNSNNSTIKTTSTFKVPTVDEIPKMQPNKSCDLINNLNTNTIKQLNNSKSEETKDKSIDDHDDHIHHENDIYFKPVIPLPPTVEIKTGEEDEQVLFSERAKLFRFTNNEWKERGIGEVKILHDLKNNRTRLLMRRDQILKVCLNHFITPQVDVKVKSTDKNGNKLLTWSAIDFSDEVEQASVFTIKFKNYEKANMFLNKIEEAKKISKNSQQFNQISSTSNTNSKSNNDEKNVSLISSNDISSTSNSTYEPDSSINLTNNSTPQKSPSVTATNKPLNELFKKPENSWQCDICYVVNDQSKTNCASCETSKPGAPLSKPSSANISNNFYNSTPNKPLSELFKKPENSWNCESCYVNNAADKIKCVSCETPKPGSIQPQASMSDKFKFNFSSSTSNSVQPVSDFKFGFQPNISSTTTNSTFKFGFSPEKSFNGNDQVKPEASFSSFFNSPEPNSSFLNSKNNLKGFSFSEALRKSAEKDSTFQFGSSQNFSFQFSGLNSPKANQTQVNEVSSPNETVASPDTSADDSIHFKPVVPLPPKIDVKTGEENEDILFNERAKLYRFNNKEWKERGTGELKILHDLENNHIRLLMRRDQVLKVCLNHKINEDFEIKPMEKDVKPGDKVRCFQWSAVDFSDEVPESQVLAVRFKSIEIADKFVNAINESKKLLNNSEKSTNKSNVLETEIDENQSKIENGDEIQVIYIKKPSKELANKSSKLMLPQNFFDYENKEDCPGCLGCEDKIPKLFYEIEKKEKEIDNEEDEKNKDDSTNLFKAALDVHGSTVSTWASNQNASWMANANAPVFGSENSKEPEFKPIIPLPDLIEVKTGEEDEEVVFNKRAKLYRYDKASKQWKERGVGEFKILRNPNTKRIRFLLRRDQVLKVACNHYLDKSIHFTPMANSENATSWYSIDYSETQSGTSEFLTLKFKNKEILEEFLKKVEELKKTLTDTE